MREPGQRINRGPIIPDAMEARSPLLPMVAAGMVFLLATFLLLLRQDAVPGREVPAGALGGSLLLALGGVAAAAASTRLGPGVRHGYNFHYLAALPALSLGWVYAGEYAPRHPFLVGLLYPSCAAFALAVLAGTSVPRPRTAAVVGALAATLALAPARPFFQGAANMLFAVPPAIAAWFLVRELHRDDEEGSGAEAPMTRTGTMYLVLNVACVPAILVLVLMLFERAFSDVAGFFAGEEASPLAAETMAPDWKVMGMRVGVMLACAASACAVVSLRSLRRPSALGAAAAAFVAATGAVLGGQAPGGSGLAVALLAGLLVAAGCGFGFAGGTLRERPMRLGLAGATAALLGLNLVEPRPFPWPVGNGHTALAIALEGLLLALVFAGVYWFLLVRIRDCFEPPVPRRKLMPQGPPPPLPPGAKPLPKY